MLATLVVQETETQNNLFMSNNFRDKCCIDQRRQTAREGRTLPNGSTWKHHCVKDDEFGEQFRRESSLNKNLSKCHEFTN